MMWAIRSTKDGTIWLGADDLGELSPEQYEMCLSTWAPKAARALFQDRKKAHQVCKLMSGGEYQGRFVVVRVLA